MQTERDYVALNLWRLFHAWQRARLTDEELLDQIKHILDYLSPASAAVCPGRPLASR